MKNRFPEVLFVTLIMLSSCQSEQEEPAPNCSASGLTLELNEKSDANCDASDGVVSLTATGGAGELVYSLAGTENTDGTFEGLAAGSYTFTVTDNNGCTDDLNVTIANLDGVEITDVQLSESGCGSGDGSIAISVTNGIEPYQYQLDDGSFQDEASFSGLAAGNYSITVMDDAGCDFTQEVEVLSGVSFSGDIEPIISNNCTFSSCHGGAHPLDFREFTTVQENAERIKTVTQNGSMPQNGSLTPEQIDLIACWVDDGALEN